MISAQNQLVVVLAVVARKPVLSPAQLATLLRVSYDANYSKVAIDGDGDLLALTELAPDAVTVQALRAAIDGVASTADAAAKALNAGTSAVAPRNDPPENVAPGIGSVSLGDGRLRREESVSGT